MRSLREILQAPIILTEGSVIERLRRDSAISLDPWIENSGLVYTEAGRASLSKIYRQYLEIGRKARLPMMLFTPTWRANAERVRKAGIAGRRVNADATEFLRALVADYEDYAENVLVGGLIGCRGDAYRAIDALTRAEAREFHGSQLEELAAAGVTFLCAATLPARSEAEGIATAMAETGLPYALSFVVTGEATLLDGTPFAAVISSIDSMAAPPPAFYMVNCVHPSVFRKCAARMAMESPVQSRRVVGLQANTSPRAPGELDGSSVLLTEDPDRLAEAMVRLHNDFGLRILGGCCGTDDRHIARLAEKFTRLRSTVV
jgi:homocysteine S-methyltransferase